MVILLVGFLGNKTQEDQYKNIWLQCLKVTVHTETEAISHVAFLFRLSEEIIGHAL